MNNDFLFPQRSWNFEPFTSQDDLFQASRKGLITMGKTVHNSYRHYYTFFTLDGEVIASFSKDDTFGFCSQAYGVKLNKHYYKTNLPVS